MEKYAETLFIFEGFVLLFAKIKRLVFLKKCTYELKIATTSKKQRLHNT